MPQPTVPPLIKAHGKAIREIRKSRHLSINRVAIHIGVTTAYLSRLERGQRGATLETLQKIADAIGASIDAITYPEPW
jgi:transcriptional regulator with XRE-family HTH domain